jgi:selenide,water dikinase
LSGLFEESDPDLIVGPETSDDAGVFRIGDECALVETTDIITPLVDDPFLFGAIAATNALSDVFAMGGSPVTAMNLLFCPTCKAPPDLFREILAGGAVKIREAGACLVGGHTVEDDELKYGLAVTGLVHPERVVRNSTAKPGDILILTKPIGTGIVSTGIKAEMVEDSVVKEACRWMTTLNDTAARIMTECGAHACTDVTGFGLIGHASEMALGARVTVVLERQRVPVMTGVSELINNGLIPGGCYRNRDYYSRFMLDRRHPQSTEAASPADDLIPLFDPQTSGGLLIALSPESAADFMRMSADVGCLAVRIGEIASDLGHAVEVR